MIKRLHPAIWVGLTLFIALIIRTQIERAHVSRLAGDQGDDLVAKTVYLAESARWSPPLIGDRAATLSQALDTATKLMKEDPAGAQAIAEEVRATLFATRVGQPGHPEILKRANELIVACLSARHGHTEVERAKLLRTYEKVSGPAPFLSLLSSLGFVLWLVGLAWLLIGRQSYRVHALSLSAVGLVSYLGFLALA